MLVAQKESFISSRDKEKGIVEDDPGKPIDKTERNHPPYGHPKVTEHKRQLHKGTETNKPQLLTIKSYPRRFDGTMLFTSEIELRMTDKNVSKKKLRKRASYLTKEEDH